MYSSAPAITPLGQVVGGDEALLQSYTEFHALAKEYLLNLFKTLERNENDGAVEVAGRSVEFTVNDVCEKLYREYNIPLNTALAWTFRLWADMYDQGYVKVIGTSFTDYSVVVPRSTLGKLDMEASDTQWQEVEL